MNLVREEKLDRQIKKEFEYNFDISKEGLYAIEISARAKSWLQNTLKLISFFKDDDLAVKIDNKEFPKLSGKKGLFDSEAAWNGNALKNLQQINIFLIYLDIGRHFLKFIADQSPLLETIRIYQVTSERNIVFEPVKNYQIESGNRRPWLNFILIDIALEGLKIQASANQRQGDDDDDDLQLKINGERQTNNTPKSHKYWYWCGRILRGQSKTFDKELNLPEGLHYIELWADNEPVVNQAVFQLTEQKIVEGEVGRVTLYTDIDPEVQTANLRAASNNRSEILKKAPNGARIVIIKKAISGSIPKGYLSDLWHEVLYQGTAGFMHSSLIEIRGQERDKIIKAIQEKAKELNIDEKFAVNFGHCESMWLPFARSTTDNRGIYQLGESTITDINEKYGGNISDPYDPYQNIDGGLKYLKFLLERYAGSSDYLLRVIVAWNVGYNDVPITGTFNLENYKDPQTKKLIDCAITERRGENVLKYLTLLILPFIASIGLWALFTSDDYKNLNAEERYLALVAQREINYLAEGENFAEIDILKARGKEMEVGYLQTNLDGDKIFEKIIFAIYSPESFSYYTNIYAPDGEKITISGTLWKAFVDDLTGDGNKELIVKTIPGHLSATYIFSYENDHLVRIPIDDEKGAEFQRTMYDENGIEFQVPQLMTTKEIRFEDLDGDGSKEIILPIRNYGNAFIEPTYYYRWNGRGFILYDQKDITLSLLIN